MKYKNLMHQTCLLLALTIGATVSYAEPDYFRLDLPNNTSPDNPQPFYCAVKPKPDMPKNPRLLIGTRAQMVTGFKNSDPAARGQLIIYAYKNQPQSMPGLNEVYFKAYQDPKETDLPGYIQIIGTGEVDITCNLGDGGGTRVLMPGAYG